jgi:hypothetical protein
MNDWQKFEARQRDKRERELIVEFFVFGMVLGGLIVWIF